jgi:putative FmdB family regulatory protein
MPVYEYECTSCGHILEKQQRISENPLTICPECSGELKKLISMSSFQLKGGGWYSDGYSGPSNNNGGSDSKKKDKAAVPPCKSGETCKKCPAATAS